MFITKIIGKTIISSVLLGGTYVLYKRIKKKKTMLSRDKIDK